MEIIPIAAAPLLLTGFVWVIRKRTRIRGKVLIEFDSAKRPAAKRCTRVR